MLGHAAQLLRRKSIRWGALGVFAALSHVSFPSSPAAAQARSTYGIQPYRNTLYQGPKPTPNDPLRVFPGAQIPENLDSYVFKTTGKAGENQTATQIPVYAAALTEKPTRVGSIPEGMEIKLTHARRLGRLIFYALAWDKAAQAPAPDPSTTRDVVWVSGNAITAVSYTPAGQ